MPLCSILDISALEEQVMKNLHKAATLFNVGFFTLSATAAFYIVYESWFYGFFLRPFPAVLTAVALMLGGAAITAICVAMKGSTAAQESSVSMSPATERFIRTAALLIPIPIMSYALLGFAVQNWHPSNGSMLSASIAYTQCERFLFGTKRADDRLAALAQHFYSENNLALAEGYAEMAVANIADVPTVFFGSTESYKKRLVDRLDLLARVYESQNKYSEALETWQRRHIAIHQVSWTSKHMKWLCSMTLAKQAYNQKMLGHDHKADTLWRLAERVMPQAVCGHSEVTRDGNAILNVTFPPQPAHDCSQHARMLPMFCNHARLLMSSVTPEYAQSNFSDKTNRYNPNLIAQEPTANNTFIMIPADEYERMTNGLNGLPVDDRVN
jgi:hypothetical protein